MPLDGSDLADRMIAVVLPLVARDGSVVELVRVVTGEDRDELGEEGARAAARDHLAAVAGALSERGVSARAHVREGFAADEILAAADELRPTLIALSSHGSGGLSRWVLGSVAERLLETARHPLLLANTIGLAPVSDWRRGGGSRELAAELAFRKILVPLDGSERAHGVLPLVREVALRCDSEVVLLHVSPPGVPLAGPEVFGSALEELHGVRRRSEVVAARTPAAAILDRASEGAFDLVAIATHGRAGERKWPFGSTAGHVLRHGGAPLLVVRTVERR